MGRARHVRLSPKSGAIADIAALRVCAISRSHLASIGFIHDATSTGSHPRSLIDD